MKIAIDAREAFGEKAGKGQLIFHLLQSFIKVDSKNEYVLLVRDEVDLDVPPNFDVQVVGGSSLMWHWRAAGLAKKIGADVYFSPTSYIVPALGRMRTVMIVHDLVALLDIVKHQRKAKYIEKLTVSRAVHNAKKIVAISQHTQLDLARLFPKSKDKTSVIYPASGDVPEARDESKFIKLAKELGLPEKYILFVGTLEPRKNVVGIIRAYAAYKEAAGDAALPLVVVGKKGWYYDEIFAVVEELGVADSITFAGFAEDAVLSFFYERAEVFFFPSFYEGFGLIILEAYRYGVPVITSRVASLPEVAGKAAAYVDPTNVEEMAKTLALVTGSQKLRDQMRDGGFEQLEKFNWDDAAKQYIQLFEEVVYEK